MADSDKGKHGSPVPHRPDTVTLTSTSSPFSSSPLWVVLWTGAPVLLPLKTVKDGILTGLTGSSDGVGLSGVIRVERTFVWVPAYLY
jgi:hypothetical protein